MAVSRPRGFISALALAALLTLTALTGVAQAKGAHGSAERVYAADLKGGISFSLVAATGRVIATRRADSLGGVLFRHVRPGHGYEVRQGVVHSGRLTVFSDRSAPPSPRIYGQRIPARGYGYLTTRDGTRLAVDVRLPGGAGPYPTLVEYSGYGYADPSGPDSGIAQLANLLGFAVVDVNMRGTGCSGGAFDYFEPLQSLDGYDVVETVARQPWVLHHRPGLVGISYGAISQLFVAATDPPHLAAITPLSTIDSTATTLYAGGILNTGFALNWGRERVHDARPASATGGQPWALKRIRGGDVSCRANQALHGEAASLIAKLRANAHYVPAVADPLDPITFVNRIHVPTFLACQFTDEQTGGHCPALVPHFTGTRRKWFTFTNGVHADSLDPQTFIRWNDFLELYVALRAPHLSDSQRAFGPAVYSTVLGIPGLRLPAGPLQSYFTYGSALTAFQAQRPVRVLFDNGAGDKPGQPYAGFAASFRRFPIPGTEAHSWYLGGAGKLTAAPAATPSADRFTWNPNAQPATDYTGHDDASGLWQATPAYRWIPNPAGTAAAYVGAPLKRATTVIGGGALQLWLKATAPTVDLQVTISEVRPDGKETFVQNGWLRADERKLDPRQSTLLAPVPTLRAADVRALPRRRFTEVTIPLYYEGHVYRRGSRMRVVVSAPNGAQPVWAFAESQPHSRPTVTIAHSRRYPSRLVLPVIPRVKVSTPLPPCPGLRGEPCRSYQPYANRMVAVAGYARPTAG